jgi:hypothetical protein
MKQHLITLAASMALFAGAAQADCQQQSVDNSASSGRIILAQASGSGSSGSSTGATEPGNLNPHLAPPNSPEGPKGAGGTAAVPMTTGTIPATPPAVGSNNAGSGGSNTGDAPLTPGRTPPNAPPR